jgi:hypothetical protein
VVAQEFFFSLEFSSQGAPAALLDGLAAQVLGHVGCTGTSLPELSDALQNAVAKGSVGGPGRCDVQFRVRGATLEIVVSANGGRVWQTSLAIP